MHNNDVFNLFLAYRPFFFQEKCFDSNFGLSALWLRMEESAVIFAAYDVIAGCWFSVWACNESPQKLEKPNFERNFLTKKEKNRKREEIRSQT